VTLVQGLARRDAIEQYRVLGEAPSTELQGLVELTATLCHVPTAVINIIDDRFQHQIAAVGFAAAACSYEDSMCAVAIRTPGVLVVPDASQDERFASNPFVTGARADVRFYASSPLITPAGVPIGTICIFDSEVRDLTEELSHCLDLIAHQIVDVLELRRTGRELEQSNEQLERFAGQVSHDLRTPLTAIAGFIEIAADSPEVVAAPPVAAALARAESAAARMGSMIADLLDFARLGGAQPRREPVALRSVVDSVISDFGPALDAGRIHVTADVDAEVTGDATLLRALFQNLIANAIKFSSAEGRDPRVDVRAVPLENGWRITVDDNGPGIRAEERERVFGFMERGTGENAPGLGIGLSTCRRIMETHGGTIGIGDSELGGASVWIILPRAA